MLVVSTPLAVPHTGMLVTTLIDLGPFAYLVTSRRAWRGPHQTYPALDLGYTLSDALPFLVPCFTSIPSLASLFTMFWNASERVRCGRPRPPKKRRSIATQVCITLPLPHTKQPAAVAVAVLAVLAALVVEAMAAEAMAVEGEGGVEAEGVEGEGEGAGAVVEGVRITRTNTGSSWGAVDTGVGAVGVEAEAEAEAEAGNRADQGSGPSEAARRRTKTRKRRKGTSHRLDSFAAASECVCVFACLFVCLSRMKCFWRRVVFRHIPRCEVRMLGAGYG